MDEQENRRRAFFLGAGASRAAGYPLSRELIAGVAEYACGTAEATKWTEQDVNEARRIRDYLFTVYGVQEEDLCRAAGYWRALGVRDPKPEEEEGFQRLPDLTEILSSIDVLVQDELSIGAYRPEHLNVNPHRVIDARELRALRRAFSRALAHSFDRLDKRSDSRRSTVIDDFTARLGPTDAVVTSNWDILLDRSLHGAFGTGMHDYGTHWRKLKHQSAGADTRINDGPRNITSRPPLLKLHGSMNWLQCRRCETLYVSPESYVAFAEDDSVAPFGSCDCKFRLATLMVTPTFAKEYKNPHLAAVWSEALRALCRSSEWIFVGYSLPADDIHIKLMLIRAFQVWADRAPVAPNVMIVDRHRDETILARYARLFGPTVAMFDGDFAGYIKNVMRPARRDTVGGGQAPGGPNSTASLRHTERRRQFRTRLGAVRDRRIP